ncbi:MAG: NAD-dependent epimerase/dehydratase family protein [Candidatus Methylacidiphilales bacterium]|nr:NAD(P)-dependent oxidoreductase [Candidatus Methylacidiphilales bacterium]
MAQSFQSDLSEPLGRVATTGDQRRKVLVTGSAGNIGRYFAKHAGEKYDLRLMVREMDADAQELREYGEVVVADLGDLDSLRKVCQGIDTVLHMAGVPDPSATWSDLLQGNIVGTYHMMVAAKGAGCRRVVLASSIHAVSGYPADVQVKTTDPVHPGDLYGVTKCFSEALGRYMASQEGLSVLAIRIGAFQPLEAAQHYDYSLSMLDAFVSERDMQQLLEKAIDVEGLKFGIFHGLSDNRFKRLDITDARELLGYKPQDDSVAESPQLKPLDLRQQIAEHSMQDSRQESGLRDELPAGAPSA